MDINNLPVEIQSKIKYFVIEHPIAKAFKKDVAINIKNDDGKTWIELIYIFNDEWIDFTTTEQEYDIFDKQRLIMIEKKIKSFKILNHFRNSKSYDSHQFFNEFVENNRGYDDLDYDTFLHFMHISGLETAGGRLLRLDLDL